MPSIQKRRNGGGSHSFVAWVRVKPFKPVSRTFPSREEAKQWAEQTERELREQRQRGEASPDVTRLTLADLIRVFLADPETRALGYYDDLERLLGWWIEHYGTARVLQLGALTLRKARGELQQQGRANGTVNRYLAALRSCWNWGRASELVPLKLVWPPRLMLTEPPAIVRYLSDEELAKLLRAAADHSRTMHAAILFSIATGVRMSELRRVRWSDIELDRQQVRILLTKNGESRGGYLPPAVIPVLQELKRASVVGLNLFIQDDGKPVTSHGSSTTGRSFARTQSWRTSAGTTYGTPAHLSSRRTARISSRSVACWATSRRHRRSAMRIWLKRNPLQVIPDWMRSYGPMDRSPRDDLSRDPSAASFRPPRTRARDACALPCTRQIPRTGDPASRQGDAAEASSGR